MVDVETTRVHLIQAEARVQVRERSHRWADPSRGQRFGCGLDGTVVRIVDHDLIFVGVAKEHVRDDVGRIAVNDLVEEIGRVGQWIDSIPATEDMSQDPDPFASIFGRLELFDQE